MDRKLEERLDRIEKAITQSTDQKVKYLNFRITVNPLSIGKQTDTSPLTGTVSSVTLSYPRGAQLVESFLYIRGRQVFPEGRVGIIIDGVTKEFTVREPVGKGDPITVKVVNHDSAWSYSISCIVKIEGR